MNRKLFRELENVNKFAESNTIFYIVVIAPFLIWLAFMIKGLIWLIKSFFKI